MYSILTSDVTEAQIIAAGYPRGVDRVSLDGSQFLIGGPDPLPASLDSFVVVKDCPEDPEDVEAIHMLLKSSFWNDNSMGGV